ncbi:MAG: hypothetical protein IT433_00970 [Phycisphaerales bacterium]|nr:hypothetical protein [Phycisphaerales bacterium]
MDSLFGDIRPRSLDGDDRLLAAYVEVGRTLDDLPYTEEFEKLVAVLGGEGAVARREVLHRLQNLRKATRLPRLGRAASPSIKVTQDEESLLVALVTEQAGTLGQRDQLVYDPRFDTLTERFNARTGRSLSRHDLWRLVAKLSK